MVRRRGSTPAVRPSLHLVAGRATTDGVEGVDEFDGGRDDGGDPGDVVGVVVVSGPDVSGGSDELVDELGSLVVVGDVTTVVDDVDVDVEVVGGVVDVEGELVVDVVTSCVVVVVVVQCPSCAPLCELRKA